MESGEGARMLTDDERLLRDILDALEYVTFHDGRYAQETNRNFQTQAQKLVTRVAERLGRKPYQEYNR